MPTTRLLEGKVALITGATSGIGRAAAMVFAEEGARVIVAGRRVVEGEETVRLVESVGGTARFVRADVTDDVDVRALVAAAIDAYDQLDCAFNNRDERRARRRVHDRARCRDEGGAPPDTPLFATRRESCGKQRDREPTARALPGGTFLRLQGRVGRLILAAHHALIDPRPIHSFAVG